MATFREYPGVVDKVLNSDGVLDHATRVARRGAAVAITLAPIDTGRYSLGINIPPGQHGGGFHITRRQRGRRWVVTLYNDTPYARYLEYGTRYMRRRRTLGKTLDHLKTV